MGIKVKDSTTSSMFCCYVGFYLGFVWGWGGCHTGIYFSQKLPFPLVFVMT